MNQIRIKIPGALPFETELPWDEAKLSDVFRAHFVSQGVCTFGWDVYSIVFDTFDSDLDPRQFPSVPSTLSDDDIYFLSQVVERITGVPPKCPYRMAIDATGFAGAGGFKLGFTWVKRNGEPLRTSPSVESKLLKVGRKHYLLSSEQYAALDVLAAQAKQMASDRETHFTQMAAVKRWCDKYWVIESSYLAEQEIHMSNGIKPDMTVLENGSLRVEPSPDGVAHENFAEWIQANVDRLDSITYVEKESGQEKRWVFNDKDKEALRELKHSDDIPLEKVPELLATPEKFFPNTDTEDLSSRIKGFGKLVAKPFGRSQGESENAWRFDDWDAVQLDYDDDTEEGPTQPPPIPLDDLKALQEIQQAIDEADEHGRLQILNPFEGGRLIQLTSEFRSQVERAIARQERRGGEKAAQDPKGLHGFLAKENLENVEYDQGFTGRISDAHPWPQPKAFKGQLREYQLTCFRWIRTLIAEAGNTAKGELGALLADDMGLGKTPQAIAVMASVRENQPREE